MENKQHILDLLLPALQATRNLHDLTSLLYDPQREIVVAGFGGKWTRSANVAGDSGTSMIKDLIKQIV